MANLPRNAVKEQFIPFLQSRGFARSKSKHPHFMIFTKSLATKILVADIQWDKYGRERFLINLSELPVAVDVSALDPFDASPMAMLMPRGDSPRWWSTRMPLLAVLTKLKLRSSPAEVVASVIESFEQAQAWWDNKSVGRHIKVSLALPSEKSLENARGE